MQLELLILGPGLGILRQVEGVLQAAGENVELSAKTGAIGDFDRSLNSSEMCMGVDWLDPGQIHLLHPHAEAEEWYYIVRGEALVRVDDEEQLCGPGTSIFIPAGARHRVHNTGTEACEFLWGFNCGDLKELTYIWYE